MQLTPGLRQTANHSGSSLCESQQTASTQISLGPCETRSSEGKDTPTSKQIFPWKVIHACEQVRDVLTVVEAQLAVGMRPFLLTPTGFGSGLSYLRRPIREKPQPVSLLQAWNAVRNWKRLLNRIGWTRRHFAGGSAGRWLWRELVKGQSLGEGFAVEGQTVVVARICRGYLMDFLA